MMEHKDIERINELARLSRTRILTPEEIAEQTRLRSEYIRAFRENMKSILDNTKIQRPDGTLEPLKKRDDP